MFSLLTIAILFIFPLQSIASVSYAVRIAVYADANSLQKEVNKLSPDLRKTIEIKKRGKEHVACSVHTEDKQMLEKRLPSYRRVFPDAFISIYRPFKKSRTKNKETAVQALENNASVDTNAHTDTNETMQNRLISNPPMGNIPLQERIQGKTLYLCAYGEETWSPNVLIQIDFFETEVQYTPIMGEASAKKELYKIEEERLRISRQGVYDTEVYNTLDAVTTDYYLISTYTDNHHINTLRYYFTLENAKAYVASLK